MRVRALQDCFVANVYRERGSIFEYQEEAPGVFVAVDDETVEPVKGPLRKRISERTITHAKRATSPLES